MKYVRLFMLGCMLGWMLWPVSVAAQTYSSQTSSALNLPGNACSVSGAISSSNQGFVVCSGGVWVAQPVMIGTQTVACSGATKGQMTWSTSGMQYCNGSVWLSVTMQSLNPAYLVMTKNTYTGAMGGLSGANATCLSDLTTNTGWKGYAAATSAGQLVSSKVKALLCDGTTCNMFLPNTTYAFASAASSAAGGATFTSDGYGYGPGDNSLWSGATYFNSTASYWSGMAATSVASMFNPFVGAGANNCTGWTSSNLLVSGNIGVTSATDIGRWVSGSTACSGSYALLCMVNP